MNVEKPDRGWRGSADIWLDAAYDILVESGVEAVKILPLAARLGLSRTSFYWHFPDREALLAGLITRWRGRNTGVLIAQAQAPAASLAEAMLNIIDCWIVPQMFDARLEFAIRTWALTDPAVARELATEDEARMAALAALFARFGIDAAEAETRAHAVYLTQIGYIAMRTEETLAQRLRRIPLYAKIFGGTAPTPAEWQAFLGRHQGQGAS
jgi:AcrR family transcriptional regulator